MMTKTKVIETIKTNHSIRFDTQVLDKWWMSTVEFKVYSRSLNQRVPTFIGSASIKLKHLLMNEKYTYDQAQSDKLSNHAGLKLTIFASSSLKQALKTFLGTLSQMIQP